MFLILAGIFANADPPVPDIPLLPGVPFDVEFTAATPPNPVDPVPLEPVIGLDIFKTK